MSRRYTITLDDGISDIVEETAAKLNTQSTKLCRDLILLQINQMGLITNLLEEKLSTKKREKKS